MLESGNDSQWYRGPLKAALLGARGVGKTSLLEVSILNLKVFGRSVV